MDHTERLTLLAINDAVHSERCLSGHEQAGPLDPKTRALVRLAAVMSVGAPGPSYGAVADAAIGAGACPAEMVDVLESIVPMVGLPCAVAAAHRLGLALGYDADGALAHGVEV
jgi:alkylhydroperoxidase/carboxymuconolactone decarboxylase family protein YurZ